MALKHRRYTTVTHTLATITLGIAATSVGVSACSDASSGSSGQAAEARVCKAKTLTVHLTNGASGATAPVDVGEPSSFSDVVGDGKKVVRVRPIALRPVGTATLHGAASLWVRLGYATSAPENDGWHMAKAVKGRSMSWLLGYAKDPTQLDFDASRSVDVGFPRYAVESPADVPLTTNPVSYFASAKYDSAYLSDVFDLELRVGGTDIDCGPEELAAIQALPTKLQRVHKPDGAVANLNLKRTGYIGSGDLNAEFLVDERAAFTIHTPNAIEIVDSSGKPYAPAKNMTLTVEMRDPSQAGVNWVTVAQETWTVAMFQTNGKTLSPLNVNLNGTLGEDYSTSLFRVRVNAEGAIASLPLLIKVGEHFKNLTELADEAAAKAAADKKAQEAKDVMEAAQRIHETEVTDAAKALADLHARVDAILRGASAALDVRKDALLQLAGTQLTNFNPHARAAVAQLTNDVTGTDTELNDALAKTRDLAARLPAEVPQDPKTLPVGSLQSDMNQAESEFRHAASIVAQVRNKEVCFRIRAMDNNPSCITPENRNADSCNHTGVGKPCELHSELRDLCVPIGKFSVGDLQAFSTTCDYDGL